MTRVNLTVRQHQRQWSIPAPARAGSRQMSRLGNARDSGLLVGQPFPQTPSGTSTPQLWRSLGRSEICTFPIGLGLALPKALPSNDRLGGILLHRRPVQDPPHTPMSRSREAWTYGSGFRAADFDGCRPVIVAVWGWAPEFEFQASRISVRRFRGIVGDRMVRVHFVSGVTGSDLKVHVRGVTIDGSEHVHAGSSPACASHASDRSK